MRSYKQSKATLLQKNVARACSLPLRSFSYLLPLCLTVGELGKRSEKAVPERTLTELPDPYSWVNLHFPIYYKSCAVKSLRLSVFKVVSCFAVGKPVLQ